MMNHQWIDFRLTDFFHLEKGNQNNMATLSEGNIPLVSARKCNNGYKQFVSKNNKRLFNGNILTLNNDGDGGAGIAFYQPYRMALDSHVTALIPKIKLNRFHLLFMAMCITKQRGSFGHGHSLNSSRLNSFKYMLPVTADKQPDWPFMENFMQKKEQELYENYKSYLKYVMPSQEPERVSIEGKKWKAFFMNEVFDIKSSVRLTKDDMVVGNRPFIGASDSNNGVTAFVGNTNNSLDSNVLGVNYNGSVVHSFYHPYEAIFSDDVKRLHFKHYKDDKYAYLFVKQAILQQKSKFEYGYKFNGERMKRQQILLPITISGEPDYDFMSAYMKRLEYDMQRRYMKYIPSWA